MSALHRTLIAVAVLLTAFSLTAAPAFAHMDDVTTWPAQSNYHQQLLHDQFLQLQILISHEGSDPGIVGGELVVCNPRAPLVRLTQPILLPPDRLQVTTDGWHPVWTFWQWQCNLTRVDTYYYWIRVWDASLKSNPAPPMAQMSKFYLVKTLKPNWGG